MSKRKWGQMGLSDIPISRLLSPLTDEEKDECLDLFSSELEHRYGYSIFKLAGMAFGRIPDTTGFLG